MSFRDHEMQAAVGRIVLAYDGAIAGLALAAFAAVSWVKYLAASAALVRIRRATSVPISGLRSLLSSDDSSDEDGVLVVVRGRVQPSFTVEALGGWPLSKFRDVLTPRGSGERAVAVLSTQTCLYNEWRGMFGWSSDLNALLVRSWKERRSSSLELVPFILADGAKSPNSGYIHVNLDGSAHPLPLTTVYHELHPVQLTPCTFFQAIFGSGYPVALLHEEKILPVGKEITAIGICRPRDRALEIKSCRNLPFFLSDMTKDELEAELISNTRILLWSGILIGTLSIGILGYALIRNWRKWKEWRMRRREIQDLHDESLIESSMAAEDATEGELCVICLSTLRRSAFIPCGHLVCCSRCALHVEHDSSPKCPVCRQDVRSSIRIYDS